MIKPPISIVVSLTVIAIGGVTLIHWVDNQPVPEPLSAPVRVSTPAAGTLNLRITAEPEATATVSRTSDAPPLVETYRQDIDALRQEVTLLRREVATMQQQLHAQRQTATETLQGREDPATKDPRTDPTARAEEERVQHERMELLEAAFWQEPADPQWAGTAATAVQTVLGGNDIGRLTLQNLECRSRSCRMELVDDNSGELAKSLPLFVHHLAETLPYVTASEVVNSANGMGVILYMSRDTSDPSQ